jgi:DNA-binding MarR family transcriptional regulator
MKQLSLETVATVTSSPRDTSELLMEVVPLVMRHIRSEMRTHRMRGLSLPQFRTLIFLNRNEGACLSQVAEHVGVTLASASKVVNALAERRLVIRMTLRNDRRYVSLKLSKLGIATLIRAREDTEAHLAERITELSPEQQVTVFAALLALRGSFADQQAPSNEKGR